MSDHSREVDDLDFLLRDALRYNKDLTPDASRVFAALRARVIAERQLVDLHQPARTLPYSSPCESAIYLYLMPLMRITH